MRQGLPQPPQLSQFRLIAEVQAGSALTEAVAVRVLRDFQQRPNVPAAVSVLTIDTNLPPDVKG